MARDGSALYLGGEAKPRSLGAGASFHAAAFSWAASLASEANSWTFSVACSTFSLACSTMPSGLFSVELKRLNAETTAAWLRMANGVEDGTEERMMEEDGAASARKAALLMKCLGIELAAGRGRVGVKWLLT